MLRVSVDFEAEVLTIFGRSHFSSEVMYSREWAAAICGSSLERR